MKRSKLRKQFLKDRTEENRKKICLTVKLLCVSHLRKTEKDEKP